MLMYRPVIVAVLVAAVAAVGVRVAMVLVQAAAQLIAEVIRSNRGYRGKNTRTNYVLIGWLLVFAAISLVLWLKISIFAKPSSPYTRLEANAHFIEAQVAFNNGEWTEAIGLYKEAFAETDDPNEKLAINYYLAAAENSNGDHLKAIPLLKEVAASQSLSDEIRAYATQFMGIMALNLSDSTAHAIIMAEIFKDAPYKDMYVANNDALSIRHLLEYASSLYPLGIAEANIARWYVGNMISNNISTTTEPGLSDLILINKKLANADKDIERTKNIIQSSTLIPQIYARKAEVMEGLSRVGAVPKEQALKAYDKALGAYPMYSTLIADDWFLRFRYAGFLANAYGQSREKDIHALTEPLYENTAYTPLSNPFFTTLGKIRLARTSMIGLEDDMLKAVSVATIDLDFKNFLISVGWKNNF